MSVDIVVTEFMDVHSLEELKRDYRVLYDPDLHVRRGEVIEMLADARALIVRNRTRVDRQLLDAAPRLLVVGRLGVGIDNIDMAACAERDIEVCVAARANASAVAEYVTAAILLLLRGVFFSSSRLLEGEWPRTELIGREVAGKRLGLVGMGAIGSEVARRAAALGMEIGALDPYLPSDHPVWEKVHRLELAELMSGADAISVHVPLTEETHHMVDGAALALLPEGAVLVNTSRGGVVDEMALVASLKEGRLGGAALDVFEQEPLGSEALRLFAETPNLVLTPHVAGLTVESHERVGAATATEVRRVLEERG